MPIFNCLLYLYYLAGYVSDAYTPLLYLYYISTISLLYLYYSSTTSVLRSILP
jgi:hypothetical protein